MIESRDFKAPLSSDREEKRGERAQDPLLSLSFLCLTRAVMGLIQAKHAHNMYHSKCHIRVRKSFRECLSVFFPLLLSRQRIQSTISMAT